MGTKWLPATPRDICFSNYSQRGKRTSLPVVPQKIQESCFLEAPGKCLLAAHLPKLHHTTVPKPVTVMGDGLCCLASAIQDHPCCWSHDYLPECKCPHGRGANGLMRELVARGRGKRSQGVRKANVHYVEVVESTPRDPYMPPWRSVSSPTSPIP